MSKWQGLPPKPNEFFGFCYLITNNITGRKYIGKKQYWKLRPRKYRSLKRPAYDKSNWREDCWTESDWEKYTGSCDPLNADIKEHGIENFTFEIISNHTCKGDLHYAEIEWQVKCDVLTAKDEEGNRLYYNGNIAAIKFIPPNKPSEKLDHDHE